MELGLPSFDCLCKLNVLTYVTIFSLQFHKLVSSRRHVLIKQNYPFQQHMHKKDEWLSDLIKA